MQKIIVIGCPGSGKSTFSKKLRDVTQLPLYHLDMLFWKPDKTTVEKDVFRQNLLQILKRNQWIIDGNYSSTMELRMKACDTVIFLDFSLDVCLDGIEKRKEKPRDDLPWMEPNEPDEDFINFVKNYNSQNRPLVLNLLEKYKHKRIFIFKTRQESDDFLQNL